MAIETISLDEASPELACQPLQMLQKLHKGHMLYTCQAFAEHIRQPLLEILFGLLTSGRNGFMKDSVIEVIHEIASADFETFFNHFIPACVRRHTNVGEPQIEVLKGCFSLADSSLLSFATNVERFLNDLALISQHADGSR
jgi:hypothetical protein